MQLHRLEEEKEDEDKYVSKARTGQDFSGRFNGFVMKKIDHFT